MRVRYELYVAGYAVMPEHVHLLVSEPKVVKLGVALQALKLSVARQSVQRPFWLPQYYDFNVFSEGKRWEKIVYMHRNPVARGLVTDAVDWGWSSYRHYLTGRGVWWRLSRRLRLRGGIVLLRRPRSQKRDLGHPAPALRNDRDAQEPLITRCAMNKAPQRRGPGMRTPDPSALIVGRCRKARWGTTIMSVDGLSLAYAK